MKTTKYILLVRRPRLSANWLEDRVGSLKYLRNAQRELEYCGEKTKIIREETTISVVKSGDLR
jgi:hypothetical protein